MNPGLLALIAQAAEPRMDTPSWVFLGAAWIAVAGLALWCFRRVLRSPPSS